MKLIKISHIVLFIALIISLVCLKTYRWDGNSGNNKKSVINSDGRGYYVYLPSIFINKNLSNLPQNPVYTNKVKSRIVNKYFVGTSLLISPFFAIAHITAKKFNYTTDGYSAPYQFMVAIASIFYLFFGLFCLVKLLALFNISDLNSAITIVLTLFGTNLFYYSVIECSMAHVYSFSMISCFALISKKLLKTHDIKYFHFAAILLGVIILVRPTNGIVFILPLVLSNNIVEFKRLLSILLKQWQHTILSLLVLFLIISIQFFVWHEQTGNFFLWSYSAEGFYFLNPQFFNTFFSFKKGLFIYTPLTLISLLGLIIVYKKNKFQFYIFTGFLFTIIYIISSWWNWYYGNSFGLRAFIDYYFIFCLLLGILLESSYKKKFQQNLLLPVLVACSLLNLIQSYQYYSGIMHQYSMNAEKYWYIFLRTSENYKNILGGNIDIEPYGIKPKKLIYSTFNDFETEYPRWNNGLVRDENLCGSGTKSTKFSSYLTNEFGASLVIQNDSLFYNSKKIFVEASLSRLEIENNSSSKVLFIIHIVNSKNENQYYYKFKINSTPDLQKCTWKTYNYSFEIPKLKSLDDKISIYLWNIEHQNFLIDDFQLNFYRIN